MMDSSPNIRRVQPVRHVFRPAKMLLSLVGRHKGEMLVAAAKAAGARGGTIALGRTVGGNRLLRMLALADISQDIVFIIMGSEAEEVWAAVTAAASAEPKKLAGLSMTLDISGMLFRRMDSDPGAQPFEAESGSEYMKSGYALITVIVNHGYADDVMSMARGAGASGGTIMVARGTGTEEDVKFFGISLVPEKEMLLIVAPNDKTEGILAAINQVPNITQPGGGVVFTMNVEKFQPLGLPV